MGTRGFHQTLEGASDRITVCFEGALMMVLRTPVSIPPCRELARDPALINRRPGKSQHCRILSATGEIEAEISRIPPHEGGWDCPMRDDAHASHALSVQVPLGPMPLFHKSNLSGGASALPCGAGSSVADGPYLLLFSPGRRRRGRWASALGPSPIVFARFIILGRIIIRRHRHLRLFLH